MDFKDMDFKDFNIFLNKSKLGYNFLDDYKENIVVIKSDTGTGKTSTVKHYLKKHNKKFISIVSRKSLAMEHHRIFSDYGLKCDIYTDSKFHNESYDNNLIITVESLYRIYNKVLDGDYVIFMDEINSIIKHLITSPTIINMRSLKEAFYMLDVLLSKADKIICVDASIEKPVQMFFNFILKNKSIIYIENKFKNNNNVKAFELPNLEKLIEHVKKLDHYIICCDSANNAKDLYERLKEKGKPIKLITGEINRNEEMKLNMDIHKRIIYSPKIIYGLDASLFSRPVFCYYRGNTINPIEMYQQISRVRSIDCIFYYFSHTIKIDRHYKNLEDVDKNNLEIEEYLKEKYKIKLISGDIYIDIIQKLKNLYTFQNDIFNEDVIFHFEKILKKKGISVFKSKLKVKKTQLKDRKQNLNNYHLSKLDSNKNIINEYLKIPSEIADQYVDILSEKRLFYEHINIDDVFISNYGTKNYLEYVNYDLIDNAKNKFIDEFLRMYKYKIKIFFKWIKLTGSTKEHIKINNNLNEDDFKEIQYDYKTVFLRGKEIIDNSKKFIITINKLIINIFGKDLYKVKRIYNKLTKKRDNKELILNNDTLDYHKKISNFKAEAEAEEKRKKEAEAEFIDSDEEPDYGDEVEEDDDDDDVFLD